MFNWVYELSTGIFQHGGPCEVQHNPAMHGVIALSRHPKRRTERYDGAGGVRPASNQEILDYDAAEQTAQALSRFDGEKLVKALAVWTAQKLDIPLATARQEILTIYRSL